MMFASEERQRQQQLQSQREEQTKVELQRQEQQILLSEELLRNQMVCTRVDCIWLLAVELVNNRLEYYVIY